MSKNNENESIKPDEFMQGLLDEVEEQEQREDFHRFAYLDFETGTAEYSDERFAPIYDKIASDIMAEKYVKPGNVTKQETIDRQREEFEEGKQARIAKEQINFMLSTATNPFLCTPHVLCMKRGNTRVTCTSLTHTEADMLWEFNNLCSGATIVAHNGENFDFLILAAMAMRNGVSLNHYSKVDTIKTFTRWGFKKEMLSLEQAAIAVGVSLKYIDFPDKSKIGEIFTKYPHELVLLEEVVPGKPKPIGIKNEEERIMVEEVNAMIELANTQVNQVLDYCWNDVDVLEAIHQKILKANL